MRFYCRYRHCKNFDNYLDFGLCPEKDERRLERIEIGWVGNYKSKNLTSHFWTWLRDLNPYGSTPLPLPRLTVLLRAVRADIFLAAGRTTSIFKQSWLIRFQIVIFTSQIPQLSLVNVLGKFLARIQLSLDKDHLHGNSSSQGFCLWQRSPTP